MKTTKSTKSTIALFILILTTLFTLTGSAFDQCEAQYVPLQSALDAMNSDAQVTVTTRTDTGWTDAPNYYYEFTPASGSPTEALIIYPGAGLDERAYAVQAHTIAASGYLVAIVPMPSYLVLNGIDRADAVISNHPEIIKWSIGGHSFGGVGACWYLTGGYTYSNKINGIVLWASYPDAAQPINTYPVKVISIWGTNDGLTTSIKIDASKPNLPADTIYVALQGANHSQFGWYGTSATDYGFVQPPPPKPGDNPAAITRQQQNDLIVQYTLSLLNSLTPANVPSALETINADDGSKWERVNVPGFGNNDNKCVVALSGYNGRLYAATRNDVSGFELWRTNGTGWEKLNVPGLTDQNNFYGYIVPYPWENVPNIKFNLMQNIWGDMIVYNGYLYLAIETGYQGNLLYGSVGCQIWRFSEAGGWEPVVADANASIISGAIDAIAGCADVDGNTTAQITISEAAGYAENHFAGDIFKVEALFSDNTPGIRVFTIISSDTSGMLTIQEQDLAGNGGNTGYTICEEHWIYGDAGRPSSIIPAITTGSISHIIMASPDVSGFGEIWNKSIVDFEIFNGELYATIGLNYLYGARIWKTSDGTTWVPNSSYSFGLFHGYYPNGYPSNPTGFCWHNTVTARNGNPVCSSFTKFGKSSVTGTETLFTGGTGTGGCNGPGARVARLDNNQWNLIVDYFADTNTTGTNENGLGDDGYPQAFQFSNFQAWSFAEYDNKLFTSIARFKGGRMMYTANGSTADDAWAYAVGGGAATTEGIGDVTNVGFNLYNYSSSLFAGSFSTVAFLPGLTINGADIWKGTGPGNNITWTRITGNGFGDTKVVEAGAFAEYYGTLYVALSTTLPANFPGEELPGAGGAKIYRLQVPVTTTTTVPATTTTTAPTTTTTTVQATTTVPATTTTTAIPTLINLSYFDAERFWRRIMVTWQTESEVDNAGFNLYRSESEDGEYAKINDFLMPAQGSSTQGASYEYIDRDVQNRKTYYYKLEDIDMSGSSTMHGPVVATRGGFVGYLRKKY